MRERVMEWVVHARFIRRRNLFVVAMPCVQVLVLLRGSPRIQTRAKVTRVHPREGCVHLDRVSLHDKTGDNDDTQ